MKIGILGTRGIPNAYGGFEQFAEHLSAGLVKKGHEVFVYNSSLHPYRQRDWHGVQIIHCKDLEDRLGTAGQFFYDWNCIKDARRRNFDILFHLGYTSDSIWHWRWPRKAVNVVNMDGLEWKRGKYNKLTQLFLRWAESLAAKNAHTMIADSPEIEKYLLNTYSKRPVYIPYGAEIFRRPNISVLDRYGLSAGKYFLMITRMEPENNVEMIIEGYLAAKHPYPLYIMGNITNKFGRRITSTYQMPNVRFLNAVYDQAELDNLRHYCSLYFHGHSVGGTNPSLLEAMACGCRIAAHNNRFNRAVLQDQADYFPDAESVTSVINTPKDIATVAQWKKINHGKISAVYNQQKVINEYETLMLDICGQSNLIIESAVAEAV